MKNIIGYRTFYRYLEYIFDAEEHDYLGGLLGGMSLLADGSTADPAYELDWDKAVSESDNQNDSYQIGIYFLRDWLAIGYIEEIGQILLDMESNKRLELWQKAVHDIQMNYDDPNFRLM